MDFSPVGIFIVLTLFGACACDDRRPFYIVGHMVNAIEEIRWFLDKGANVIESDIQFHRNGSVKMVCHGYPCDCNRTCNKNADLQHFLKHMRDMTEPDIPGSYADRMVMQFFDLKLRTSGDKKKSGRELARHVLDYLWSKDGKRKQEVRINLL